MADEIKRPAGQDEPSVPAHRDYTEELTRLIRSRRPIGELREELDDYHDSDIAETLAQLT